MNGQVQRTDGSIVLLDENHAGGDALELPARLAVQVHRARASTRRTTRSRWRRSRSATRGWRSTGRSDGRSRAARAHASRSLEPPPEPSPLRTDVAGFVGRTRRGPVAEPVRVEGWREYQRGVRRARRRSCDTLLRARLLRERRRGRACRPPRRASSRTAIGGCGTWTRRPPLARRELRVARRTASKRRAPGAGPTGRADRHPLPGARHRRQARGRRRRARSRTSPSSASRASHRRMLRRSR